MRGYQQGSEVLPERGFDAVLFGMTIGEVARLLGRPDRSSIFDLYDEWSLVLHFPGLDLFFDQSEAFRLCSIEVEKTCRCTLFGEALFPRSRDNTLDLLRRNLPASDFAEIRESVDEDLEEATLRAPSIWMTFYFTLKGRLKEVGWTVPIGRDDEVAWPLAPKDEATGVGDQGPRSR